MGRKSRDARQTSPDPICIECGARGQLTTGAVAHPNRPDLHEQAFYVCSCGAGVGCHPGTTLPLGRPAGPDTARARDRAHRVFDPLWRAKEARGMRRSKARGLAYSWLAGELGLPPKETHISWFDRATCERVIEICTPHAERLKQRRPGGTARPGPGSARRTRDET